MDHDDVSPPTSKRREPAQVVANANGKRSTPAPSKKPKKSQAQRIIDDVLGQVERREAQLFLAPGGEPFASFDVDGHIETWPIKSRDFRLFLCRRFFMATNGMAASTTAIREAQFNLESHAGMGGIEIPVHVRVAEADDGRIVLDLADKQWRAVEVSAAGWKIVSRAPVKFTRKKGMLPLPEPARGGRLDDLRRLINVDDNGWTLILSWLVAAFRPQGPYPVLVLGGEHGTAKSSASRILRGLIDPNKAPIRDAPKESRDLVIAATNGWIIAIDNLSHLADWLSDALCRLATGGGYGTRELYENAEETILDAQRPVILNGIGEVATRGDILSRSLVVQLATIPEDRRCTEKKLWGSFGAAAPGILGALLDAVAYALQGLPTVNLARLPRMADFAMWATAAEPALGFEKGAFMDAYADNRADANEVALEASPIVPALRALLSEGAIQTNVTDLFQKISAKAGEATTKSPAWPKTPRALGTMLTRMAPNLRAANINISRQRTGNARLWLISPGSSPIASDDGSPAASDGVMTQTSLDSVLRTPNRERGWAPE